MIAKLKTHGKPTSLRKPQRGAALLLMFLTVFFVGLSFLFHHTLSLPNSFTAINSSRTALVTAKAAVIGRAAADNDRPGSLPCPDIDNDGNADPAAGNCTVTVGRFPWKTLKTGELRDGYGEVLWYAMPLALRDISAEEPINSVTNTGLTLDSQPEIAAIIFSPGPPLATQTGRPSNNVVDYLEGSNASTSTTFESGPQSIVFNDQLIAITRDELFRVVGQRVLGEIRGSDDSNPAPPSGGLRQYHNTNGSFPDADMGGDGTADTGQLIGKVPYSELVPMPWLNSNGWYSLVTYTKISGNCIHLGLSGTATMSVRPCPSSPCPVASCP